MSTVRDLGEPITNPYYAPEARVEYLERQIRWLQEKLEQAETDLKRARCRIHTLEQEQRQGQPPQNK